LLAGCCIVYLGLGGGYCILVGVFDGVILCFERSVGNGELWVLLGVGLLYLLFFANKLKF
jgi:hypothetical protein